MDIRNAQMRLGLKADGIAGPKTWAALFAHQGAKPDLARELGESMSIMGGEIDTPLEMSHFLAQAAHETMGFRHLVELGGPSYCAQYDDRKDLGNTQAGDGYRFRGRGIFHLTGRGNYLVMGRRLGVDLVADPGLAAMPNTAVFVALIFWRERGLSKYALNDDITTITKRINGGLNGFQDREERLAKLKRLFS